MSHSQGVAESVPSCSPGCLFHSLGRGREKNLKVLKKDVSLPQEDNNSQNSECTESCKNKQKDHTKKTLPKEGSKAFSEDGNLYKK